MKIFIVLVVVCFGGSVLNNAYAQTERRDVSAVDFFPRPEDFQRDARPVVYIELPSTETLVLDEKDNASYVLYGRALEIHATSIKVNGKVVIRSFSEDFVPDAKGGAAAKGDDGPDGPDGHGDGKAGEKGGRGKRGHTGDPGTKGMSAHKSVLVAANVSFASDDSSLTFYNQGQRGGKGQKGGKGGTGGRGGHGQDRQCGGDGPGNAGPKGAAGARGTGGQGGTGGAGGEILVSKAFWSLRDKKVILISTGGKGGDPGDPGDLGEQGQPGGAGAGSGACGKGGDAFHIDADAPEGDVPPSPSTDGTDASVSCIDCASQVPKPVPAPKPTVTKPARA